MRLTFENRKVVVTGGAMGIGKATARQFSQLGATVAIVDVNAEAGEKTSKELQSEGGRVNVFPCDVSQADQVVSTFNRIRKQLGGIDVLVSNAAIQRYGDVINTAEDVWDEVMAVNLKSLYLVSRQAIPAMIERGGGAVIVTGSVQSLSALANSAAYVTAKHGLLGLVRAMALDYARHKVRVNIVCPGAIDTPMFRSSVNLNPEPDKVIDTCNHAHPLGRIGQPEEVARAIVFLASDWASFITGSALLVDGGMLVPAGGMAFQEGGTGSQ